MQIASNTEDGISKLCQIFVHRNPSKYCLSGHSKCTVTRV